MLIESVAALMARELSTLAREVEAYPDEASIWLVHPAAQNSGGVLARHLCGNLRHFVGAALGAAEYRRDREMEFRGPPTPRPELLAEIDRTRKAVADALAGLARSRLAEPYPVALAGHRFTTGDFLLHLAVHLAYHLGQVDYHRRLTTGGGTVGAMALPELASATPE